MAIRRIRKRPRKIDFKMAPATVLRRCMDKYGYTNTVLAKKTGRSDAHISNILNEKAGISPAFAVDLEKAFPRIAAEFWMELEVRSLLNKVREREFFD